MIFKILKFVDLANITINNKQSSIWTFWFQPKISSIRHFFYKGIPYFEITIIRIEIRNIFEHIPEWCLQVGTTS